MTNETSDQLEHEVEERVGTNGEYPATTPERYPQVV